jgi:hypothetical protein
MDNGNLNPAIESYNRDGSTIYRPIQIAGTNRVDLYRVRPTQPFTELNSSMTMSQLTKVNRINLQHDNFHGKQAILTHCCKVFKSVFLEKDAFAVETQLFLLKELRDNPNSPLVNDMNSHDKFCCCMTDNDTIRSKIDYLEQKM